MKNQVRIVENPNTGEVTRERVIKNDKGEERTVHVLMVESKELANLSGIGRVAKRNAFLTLEQDAYEFMLEDGKLVDGATIPGKIIVEEKLEPYTWTNSEGKKMQQEPKINPSTKEVITYQGQPVYRNTIFTQDLNSQDVLLRESTAAVPSVTE